MNQRSDDKGVAEISVKASDSKCRGTTDWQVAEATILSQDRRFLEETEITSAILLPLRYRVAYLNYSCLPRAP